MMDKVVMLGNWQFDLSQWWVAAAAFLLVSALPLSIIACWRRLSDRSPARATLAIVLNMLAFTALFLLLTEPTRQHMASRDIVLVSEGADVEISSINGSANVYIAPGAMPPTPGQTNQADLGNANWLLDVGQLSLREPALANVELLGYGLDESQWQTIPDDVRIDFVPPSLHGFYNMRWPQALFMGQTMTVQGNFSAAVLDTIVEIRLLDPAGKQINQRRIKSGEQFSLMARPKSPGNTLYRLQAWQNDTMLSDQPVTVSVDVAKPMQIMVKQSAPSYETRQLKDFAADIGTEVSIYTNTSTGKSITQMVNHASIGEGSFSPSSLASSDWLIMDGRALTELPATQRQWLYDAVNSGLGLLLIADGSLFEEFEKLSGNLLKGFALSTDNDTEDEVIPQLVNVASFPNELSLPKFPLTLGAKTNQSPLNILVSDQSGRPLVASQDLGLGKVAINLIGQSYRWVTAGHRTSWTNYWSAIGAALSRQKQDGILIPPADNEFFEIGKRSKICAFTQQQDVSVRITSGSSPAQSATTEDSAITESLDLYLIPDSLGSDRKCGWYWPGEAGWEELHLLSNDNTKVLDHQSRFIWNEAQWPGQKRYERRNATIDRQEKLHQTADQPNLEKQVTEPLNTFLLWLLFISSASALWLERKLDWNAA